jgi:hypothetical protein
MRREMQRGLRNAKQRNKPCEGEIVPEGRTGTRPNMSLALSLATELEEPEASSFKFSLPQGSWTRTFQVVIRLVPVASLASQYAPRRSLLSLRRRRLRPGRRRRREWDVFPSRLPPAGPPGSSSCSRSVIGRARRGDVIAPHLHTRAGPGFRHLGSALQANRWNRTLATRPAAGVFFYAQGQ